MIKQIMAFKQDNINDLGEFLLQYPDAEILIGGSFAINKQTKHILSIGDRNDVKSVPRPSETPYEVTIIYVVYEADGSIEKGKTTKVKMFSAAASIQEINKFLADHYTERVLILPTNELTGPLDNYFPGEYGPIPDRSPATVKSHKLVILYKE